MIALTATPEGRRCFEKMGLESTGYEEYWVASDSADGSGSGGVELVTVSAGTAPQEFRAPEEAAVRGHARMLAKHLGPGRQ